jgi:hypothetical protein
MQEYQIRAVDEKRALDQKQGSLKDFMHSDEYAKLAAVDQGLLMVQMAAMASYSDALHRRIELF